MNGVEMTKKEVEKLGYIDSVNAAKLIGCSKSSLYNATAGKKISYYKLGKFMYFKPEDVEMYKKELNLSYWIKRKKLCELTKKNKGQKNCELIKIEKKPEPDLMAAEHFKKVGDVVEYKSDTDLELTDGKKFLRHTSFINVYLDNWQKTFNSILEEMRLMKEESMKDYGQSKLIKIEKVKPNLI
jgi:excisionase family DNA binding protein